MKRKGLAKPNWDLEPRHNSDGPECHGGRNMKGESLIPLPSDITRPIRSPALPVKGNGKAKYVSNFPETVAHALEKSCTIAKDYLGGQMKKLGEVTIASILPRTERIPTLIIGQKGSGDP